MDLCAVQTLARGHILEKQLEHNLKWLTDVRMYSNVPKQDLERARPSTLPMTHILQMEESKFVERTTIDEVKAYGNLFGVFEQPKPNWPKGRIRPVFDDFHVNEHTDYSEDTDAMDVNSTAEQIKALRPGDHASAFDMTSSFHQMNLSPEVRAYHCFRASDGSWWRYMVEPMGHGPASCIMDTVMKILATARMKNPPRVTQTFVDNVRFVDNVQTDTVQDSSAQFLRNCAFVKCTLNDEPLNKIHTQGVWCGVFNNYTTAEVRLPQRGLDKLEKLPEYRAGMSVADLFERMGYIFFASFVLQTRLDRHYMLMKYYRRVAARFSRGEVTLETNLDPWSSTYRHMHTVTAYLKQNTDVCHFSAPKSPVTMFTDASDKGWGATLFTQGRMFSFGAVFSNKEAKRHINEKESMAIVLALEHFASLLHGRDIILKIDNTSVIGALRKGYSPSFRMNSRVTEALDALHDREGATFAFEYVPSKDNLADFPSRNPGNHGARLDQRAHVPAVPQIRKRDCFPTKVSRC